MACISLNKQSIRVENIYCIGRNYSEHIKEMRHQIDDELIAFQKPNSAIATNHSEIELPNYSKSVHYECELVVLIGRDTATVDLIDPFSIVAAYAVGLDLTARDVQTTAIQKGLPWLKAKGFRQSACVSNFIAADLIADINNITFSLTINDELKQVAQTSQMIYDVATIIKTLNQLYGLKAGDLIFTGTPKGVGELKSGDQLAVELNNHLVDAYFTVK